MGPSRTKALGRRRRKRRPAKRGLLALTAGRTGRTLRAPVLRAPKHPLRPPSLRSPKHVPRPSWKLLGLAGIAGVAATGVVVARKRRAHVDLPADELRERLHARLAEAGAAEAPQPSAPPS